MAESESDNANGNGRSRWAIPQITVGNWLTIIVIVAGVIAGWTRMEAHVGDSQIHQPIEQRQATIREHVRMLDAPIVQSIDRIDEQLRLINAKLDRLSERSR